MKIYNHIKIDIDTLEVLEEDSFEYNGPIAECQSSSSSSTSFSSSSSSTSSACPDWDLVECKTWPCNINDSSNEVMIISWPDDCVNQ